MFESEDFDLDEDFLEDIGKKEEEYYSQKPEIDPPVKRQKTEPLDSDFFGDINFDDEPDFARPERKSVESSPGQSFPEGDNASLRKKRSLEIFSSGDKSIYSQNSQENPKNLLPALPKSTNSLLTSPPLNVEDSRKALALEILRKGSLEKAETEKSPKPLPPKCKNNGETAKIADSCGAIIENTRESFKKPAERFPESSRKISAMNVQKCPSRDRGKAAPRMTLIRRFPGPAGLLPDTPDSNLDHANFLNSLDNFGADENLEDSKISDYCSQNTERLFSSGAWRSMLDDLPANFLKGHEIATIKRLGRDSWERSRVSFVAGLVQRIDQSVDNPRLLIKDMTDSIEATMHSDFPLAHPNILEPGVVILLRDVGLLGYQGSQKCPGPQYHLMISPSNVLAIYSEKNRLVSSPFMDSIAKSSRTLAIEEGNGLSSSGARNERKILSERNAGLFENMEISDFESEDEETAFGLFNLGDITNSQTSSSFSKPTTNFTGKYPGVGNSERREANFAMGKSRNFKVARKSPGDKNVEKIEGKKSSEEAAKIEIKPKVIVGVRSRLLQFKSNDVLTPSTSDEAKITENSTPAGPISGNSKDENKGGTFGDDLLASDEDTEDEMLSQLDVDSIMTKYNSGS